MLYYTSHREPLSQLWWCSWKSFLSHLPNPHQSFWCKLNLWFTLFIPHLSMGHKQTWVWLTELVVFLRQEIAVENKMNTYRARRCHWHFMQIDKGLIHPMFLFSKAYFGIEKQINVFKKSQHPHLLFSRGIWKEKKEIPLDPLPNLCLTLLTQEVRVLDKQAHYYSKKLRNFFRDCSWRSQFWGAESLVSS